MGGTRTMVDPLLLRATMSAFATGVAVVTTEVDGEAHGMTVNSLTSVSLDPPLLLVCLTKGARTEGAVRQRGAFAVNLLGSRQQGVSTCFARPGDDHFAELEIEQGETGVPLVPKALGWLECEVEKTYPGGDHTIVVGRVLACRAREGTPLLFYRGRYHEIHGEGHEAPWLW